MSEPTATAPVCYRHTDRETWIRCQRCDRPICPDCMLPAAVGFQCPSCVKDGAKTTRTGRLPYGGERSANPALTSLVIVGLNVAVWVAIQAQAAVGAVVALIPGGACTVDGGLRAYPTVGDAATCAAVTANGEWVAGVADGAPWQVLTSVFAHQGGVHLLLNLMVLYFLGPQLESVLGRTRFIALYLISGLAGSAAVMLLSEPHSATLGASGAGFGLMGALLVVTHKVRADTQPILVWLGINIAFTFLASSYISWQGHLGGLAGGLLVTAILVYAPKANRGAVQAAGLTLLSVVVLGLIVLRAIALA